jgi:hypothetical protein
VRTVEEIKHGIIQRRMRGVRSRRTQEELRADAEAGARKELDVSISKEVNRTLLELWKMENVEALRNRR